MKLTVVAPVWNKQSKSKSKSISFSFIKKLPFHDVHFYPAPLLLGVFQAHLTLVSWWPCRTQGWSPKVYFTFSIFVLTKKAILAMVWMHSYSQFHLGALREQSKQYHETISFAKWRKPPYDGLMTSLNKLLRSWIENKVQTRFLKVEGLYVLPPS